MGEAMLTPITRDEYKRLQLKDRYWRNRWNYLSKVGKWVNELKPQTALEIGPHSHPTVHGCDTLDISNGFSPTFCHDAGVAPWPIPSSSYDLVIGLQCWEHFEGNQLVAFLEAVRVTKPEGHIILSFPYKWKNTNSTHAGIGARRIREWTAGFKSTKSYLAGADTHRPRMLVMFRTPAVNPV